MYPKNLVEVPKTKPRTSTQQKNWKNKQTREPLKKYENKSKHIQKHDFMHIDISYIGSHLFLTGVESIKQNLTTDELKTSPSSLDNSLEGVLYDVRLVVWVTGLFASVNQKRRNNSVRCQKYWA